MAKAAAKSTGANASASGIIPMYVIFGEEAFLRRQALRNLINSLGGRSDEWSLSEYIGNEKPEPELAVVLDDARTPSLLASKRVVVVRRAEKFIQPNREQLLDYLDRPSDCGVLVLECEKFLKTTKLHKRLSAMKAAIECLPLSAQAAQTWAIERAQQPHARRISREAAAMLVDLVGTSMDRLDGELGKLAAYIGKRETIEDKDVDAVVGSTRMEIIFKVTDALCRRDARGALELWNRVLATDKAAEHRSIGGLSYGIRRMAHAARLHARGESVLPAAGRVFDMAAFMGQLKMFPVRQWEDMLQRLLQIDAAAKSGGGDASMGIEKFLVEMCGGR